MLSGHAAASYVPNSRCNFRGLYKLPPYTQGHTKKFDIFATVLEKRGKTSVLLTGVAYPLVFSSYSFLSVIATNRRKQFNLVGSETVRKLDVRFAKARWVPILGRLTTTCEWFGEITPVLGTQHEPLNLQELSKEIGVIMIAQSHGLCSIVLVIEIKLPMCRLGSLMAAHALLQAPRTNVATSQTLPAYSMREVALR
eukprot:IDg6991t1